jgi:dTDP-4-dehydrorhamnose 3,5-epimerase
MEPVDELFPGVWHFKLRRFEDQRGSFVKSLYRSALCEHGIEFELREEFYSYSYSRVIRGMHFQLPPHQHAKIVYCAAGLVRDVLLDLRSGPSQGKAVEVILNATTPSLLFIPAGIAHGFLALADNTLMVYKTSTEHVPTHDAGIRWDSFGFDWGLKEPIISTRDQSHPTLSEFKNPF